MLLNCPSAFPPYTVLPFYDTSDLLKHRTYDSCRSNAHSILLICPTPRRNCRIVSIVDSAVTRSRSMLRMHTILSIGQMHTFCRLDVQLQQVGCATLIGRMHNFCRSDAQMLFVEGITLVGRMHNNYSRSDSQLLQVGCTDFKGRRNNFSRSDTQLK